MNFSNYRFTLDLHSLHSQTSIPVMLGDTGITWHINLCDGGKPYLIADGCLAKISIKRPTGTYLEAFCEIRENTTIVYPFEQDTCASVGLHNCEITLYGINGAVLGTPRFSMVVGDRVLNNDDINITDQDRTIVDAMVVEEAKRQVAEESRVARFEETIENMNSQFEETVGSMNSQFDETVGNITSQFNETHENITSRFDETVVNMNAQFDRTVEDMGEQVDKFVEDMKEEYKNPTIHIGPEAPENDETIWIDTDEEESAEIDVVAKVGQVIAVKSVDAKGKPVDYKAVDLPKVPTPNWNANEGEGFIEGRTHYVDKNGVVHKLDNKYIDADWMATKEDGGAGKTVFIPGQTVNDGMWSDLRGPLVEGVVYAVEVNGLMYECKCHSYDGTLYLGNGSLLGDDTTEHNNKPFCIAWMGGAATGGMFYSDGTLEATIGIEVRDWQDTIRNKLPEEYLPDCAVKGDENGVLSWLKLSDKPFVEGAGELLFTHTATFATDAAAKNGVLVAGAEVTAILDTVYWLEVNGELLKCHWERVSFSSVLYDEDGNEWVSYGLTGVYVSAPTAGTYTYKFYAPSDELMLEPKYLPPNLAKKSDIPEGVGGANIDVVASVGQTIVVEEVDADGKPTKWKAAEFQERTHWSEETVGVLVPQTVFKPILNSLLQMPTYILPEFGLESGKTYTVVYDGVEYPCTAVSGTLQGLDFVSIGNAYLANGTQTSEPFIVAKVPYLGATCVIDLIGGEKHAIQINGDKTVYHKPAAEYAPNEYRAYILHTGEVVNGSYVYHFNADWNELTAAIEAQKNIYADLAYGTSNGRVMYRYMLGQAETEVTPSEGFEWTDRLIFGSLQSSRFIAAENFFVMRWPDGTVTVSKEEVDVQPT
jgi:hypothetical protein